MTLTVQELCGVWCMTLAVPWQVALVSFYAAQLQLLRQELRSIGLDKDERISVMTVDACQGCEMQGVVISCVRSNKR